MSFFERSLHRNTGVSAPTPRAGHVAIGPISVLDGSPDDAAQRCLAAIRARTGGRVATANLDFVAQARRDRVLRADLSASTLVVADGAPVAWLARLAGAKRTRRTTGVDLVAAILGGASQVAPLRVVIYGSTPDVAGAAAARFATDYEGVEVAAVLCPPFGRLTPEQSREYADSIAAAEPHLVLVALGCPRQERFIAEQYAEAPQALWIGVGGTFDFYAGKRRRAPRLVGATGGEWLVRLVQEPRRLWRRYLLRDLPTLLAVTPAVLVRRVRNGPPAPSGGVAEPGVGGPIATGADDDVRSAAL